MRVLVSFLFFIVYLVMPTPIEITSSSSDHKDDVSPNAKKRRENDKDIIDGDESPIDMKTAEEREKEDDECCILSVNPFESSIDDLKKELFLSPHAEEVDEDISIILEKGKVACKDYPHPRHLCAEYPFNSTPHESYCPQCYCYVCEIIAPCKFWKQSCQAHCDASDQDKLWICYRNASIRKLCQR